MKNSRPFLLVGDLGLGSRPYWQLPVRLPFKDDSADKVYGRVFTLYVRWGLIGIIFAGPDQLVHC